MSDNNNKGYDELFKIILVGDSNVGKTSYLLTKNVIKKQTQPTIGVEYAAQSLLLREADKIVKAIIWDTAGAEKYKAITTAHYRKSEGALLFYDLTDQSSFDNLLSWRDEIIQHVDDKIVIMVIGNKVDLVGENEERAVSQENIERICKDNNMMYMETSAKEGTNIKESFEALIQKIYDVKSQRVEEEIPLNTLQQSAHLETGKKTDEKIVIKQVQVQERKDENCSHIDHGKSTLADRFLEITNTIVKGEHEQYLDKLGVEKERGITVKAQSAAMYYQKDNIQYLFNLIDTPGHVDFTYEVSRSMRGCEGALLLVDATQGIQAQTLSNYNLAKRENLQIIPVLNKVDMIQANVEEVTEQMVEVFNFNPNEIVRVSAKTGLGVPLLLETIVDRIPPPKCIKELKCFLIDSWYVKDKGVILLILIRGGILKKGSQIFSCAFNKKYDVFEVGILNPEYTQTKQLEAGQVGYVMTNMKAANEARVGDTFKAPLSKVEPEPGFAESKPLVYCGIYPEDPDDFGELSKSIVKLGLTDPAVTISKESSAALGNGFRCGFLGVLHMDVFRERLEEEYNLSVILTSPSVPYKAVFRDGKELLVENAIMAPDPERVKHYEQPMAEAVIMAPSEYSEIIFKLCDRYRGVQQKMERINKQDRFTYKFPLHEIIQDFFDKLKSETQGYGSLEYEFCGYEKAKIAKLVIHLMDEPVDALSFMVPEDKAHQFGKSICLKLKESIPKHLFIVSIQAKIGGKVVAAEKISTVGKNVTAKCYGGDYTRKKKLLDRQKEGKKRMREIGRVTVKKDTFINLFKD